MSRKLVVTAALPYANGPIHIGHLVEYVQTDIWVRYHKLVGNPCLYVCADDAHGTPIMISARDRGIEPAALIAETWARHAADFRDFQVEFDVFHSTHSPENRECATRIYERLRDGGHIVRRPVAQAYDAKAGMFLPDRFIRGTCPRCRTADQYGDSCENCGATYAPTELIDPRSLLSGTAPEVRESEHLFFQLGHFEAMLKEWIDGGHVQPEVRNKLQEWFDQGLRDWDISRDAPYWGFEIPGEVGKYFYVWLDAPIGYMASHLKWCRDRAGAELTPAGGPPALPREFDEVWAPGSEVELVHFIGKDIAYFHTLFWPAVLHGSGHRTPTAVYCHGFLTVDGRKMSKSRGTFISARTWLDHLDPQALRYYIGAKLGPGVEDLDLSLDDFVFRVNSDLVGKVVNIASRCAGILGKQYGNRLAAALHDASAYAEAVALRDEVGGYYEGRDTARAVRAVTTLADRINKYIDASAPWKLVKDPATFEEGRAVCTQGLNLYRVLVTLLSPVVPKLAADSAELLRSPISWKGLDTPLLDHELAPFRPLALRVERAAVDAMVEASKAGPPARPAEAPPATDAAVPPREVAGPPVAATISLEDFQKVDLRVARITSAVAVEKAEKLVQLTVDLGFESRTVFAGIKAAFAPADLVGRTVVIVANLAPRTMRFGVSEGMILAAGEGSGLVLLDVEGAAPGTRIK